MTMVTRPVATAPQDDLKTVVENRTREWHFHIYFLLQSSVEKAAALSLRDAVLKLRRDGRRLRSSLFVLILSYDRRIRRGTVVQSQ